METIKKTKSKKLTDSKLLPQPTVITIGNYKGGVGKTTFALNLAATISKKNKFCCLVGADPQNNISNWGANASTNILNLEEAFKKVNNNSKLYISEHNLMLHKSPHSSQPIYILPYGENADFFYHKIKRNLSNIELTDEIYVLNKVYNALLKAGFEYVIVDTCPNPDFYLNETIVVNSDIIIPITDFSNNSISGLKYFLSNSKKYISRRQKGIKIPVAVINDKNHIQNTKFYHKKKDEIKSYLQQYNIPKIAQLSFTYQYRINEEQKSTIWERMVGKREHREEYINIFSVIREAEFGNSK